MQPALRLILTACIIFGVAPSNALDHHTEESRAPASRPRVTQEQLDQAVARFSERPLLAVRQMTSQYGLPHEATTERVIWHDAGPFRRIVVTSKEISHDFPKPHMDFIEHTIAYRVPTDKAGDLLEFDGSVKIDRTAGELSARCDLESHNILTLNLAHDIVNGKKSVEQARQAFGDLAMDDLLGKKPEYVTHLQFQHGDVAQTADPGTAVIPGAPRRGPAAAPIQTPQPANGAIALTDAEILGFAVAINENELLAANEALKKELRLDAVEFAQLLLAEHGSGLVDTIKLGQSLNIPPLETPGVDALRRRSAGDLAKIVLLQGEPFTRAFLQVMEKGHADALQLIDTRLLPGTQNEPVKQHVAALRHHVASHLDIARRLLTGESGVKGHDHP